MLIAHEPVIKQAPEQTQMDLYIEDEQVPTNTQPIQYEVLDPSKYADEDELMEEESLRKERSYE